MSASISKGGKPRSPLTVEIMQMKVEESRIFTGIRLATLYNNYSSLKRMGVTISVRKRTTGVRVTRKA